MKFSNKVLLMPALAGASFVGVLLINEVMARANARLAHAIQQEYLPALLASRDVETSLVEIQRSLHDAVAASDPEGLAQADKLSAQLRDRLGAAEGNPAFEAGEVRTLDLAFSEYYDGARATTRRLMGNQGDDSLPPALEKMAWQYARLRNRLQAAASRQMREMEAALGQANENRRRSSRAITLAVVAGLLALGAASRFVVVSTIGSLRRAVTAAAAVSGRTIAVAEAHGTKDEIDQLLSAMQEMMAAHALDETRLNAAQRLAHVGSWAWDPVHARVTWSEELSRIFGASGPPSPDLEGYLALVHPDDRARVRTIIEGAYANRQPFQYQARIVRPDGEVRTVFTHNEVILDGSGAVAGLHGSVQDVTEIDRTAMALRESEERYRNLFQDNPQPTWVYDRETLRFLAVNDAAIANYGYSEEDFLSLTIADIRPEEDREALRDYVNGQSPGLERSSAGRHRRKDGSLLDVEVSSHVVSFGHRQARLVLANDVTERRRLEQQLRQTQKMEAVGRLAGGMAHDFNNILNVIMGYSEIVARRLPAGDPLAAKVGEILKAADRAGGLTRQLLAFSRKQVLQSRVFDLNGVVAEMERMLRRLIGENIALQTRLQDRVGAVIADPGQMEQVIMNLAVNASDAMPGGGALTLETRGVTLDDSYVQTHPGAHPGPHVMLAVSDTGHGMDTETMARIFEPFFTTKALGKGTGLGLSTVYGIVEQSGGHIEVDSEPGRGTTFNVFLPMTSAGVGPARPAAPAARDLSGSETILLVEDEPALRSVIRESLEQMGYRILEGVTPSQALAAAETYDGRIHLMLTDVVMPEMSGPQLAERLKALRPQTAVVYMSGYADEAVGHHLLLDPAVQFLNKPFTTERLLSKLREVLSAENVKDE